MSCIEPICCCKALYCWRRLVMFADSNTEALAVWPSATAALILPVTRFRLDETLLTVENLGVELTRKLVADEARHWWIAGRSHAKSSTLFSASGDVAPQLIESFVQGSAPPGRALGGRLKEFRLECLDDRVERAIALAGSSLHTFRITTKELPPGAPRPSRTERAWPPVPCPPWRPAGQ